jgi:transposase
MNQLTVNKQEEIIALKDRGWSARRIARELGFDRDTVRKYLRAGESKPATLTTGSLPESGAQPPAAPSEPPAKPATPTTGSSGEAGEAGADAKREASVGQALAAARANVSLCESWKEQIEAGLDRHLSAKRIHQDLVQEHGFTGGYQSVKRFVRRLEQQAPVPYRRMDFAPGEQMQVDFGQGAWVVDEAGKKRRPHLFRAVLSCSRKGYSEAVWDQKTETFIRCIENAFRHFGGVTVTLTPDNLKAAVLNPDWYDPEINPKLASFARHYKTVILPTKPAMPRHKGRVERGVDFVQENALKGRTFASLAAENTFLAEWEKHVADTRIHGTTRQQVDACFIAVEQAALQPLPASIFPSFTEGKRRVHLDGHVEFDKAYYSVPPEYVGREVWVRGGSRLIRVYTLKMESIASHTRAEPGRSSSADAHIHPLKRRIADRGVAYLLARCQEIGPCAGAWAQAMYKHRGIEGIRVLQGLLGLARKQPATRLELAAGKALQRADWKLQGIKQALLEPENVVQVDFLEAHPLIRDMDAYRLTFPS